MSESSSVRKICALLITCFTLSTAIAVLLPEAALAAVPQARIAGHVTGETGPLANSMVLVMVPGFEDRLTNFTFTDSSGDYVIDVIGGVDYGVMAFNDSCYAKSAMVHTVAGSTVYLDFTLEPIAPAVADVVITGFVKDELGNPVSNGYIGGFSNDPVTMGNGPPMYVNITRPDPSGAFTVNVLPSPAGGGVAALGFPGYGLVGNDAAFPLESGRTYWINVTLSKVTYNDDATLSGLVTDAETGLPLEGVLVSYTAWDESSGRDYSNITWTDATGHYFMSITSGQDATVMMSKPGYTIFRMADMAVFPGANLVVNAELRRTTATVKGFVWDASTGTGISFARVYLVDPSFSTASMAYTNATGAYTLDAFDGTGLLLFAEADGYGRAMNTLDIAPGDTLWVNFSLRGIDARVSGKVRDAITGDPVPGAGLQFTSASFSEWAQTNATGDYSVALVSDQYTVQVWAPGYRDATLTVKVLPGDNTLDVSLTPWSVPATVRLYGWVNSSQTGTGIFGASVKVGEGAPYYGQQNMTWTNAAGYYEMRIPSMRLYVVGSAFGYAHYETVIDASAVSEVRVDMILSPDDQPPVVVYTQSPTANVSFVNPSHVMADAEEEDILNLVLWQMKSNGTAAGVTYYYALEMLWDSFDPTSNAPNNLPYLVVGNHYIVDMEWPAKVSSGGMLLGSLSQVYLSANEGWWGSVVYNTIPGYYRNSSMSGPASGTAWFSRSTGNFAFFTFDDGLTPPATPADPTGVFLPFAPMIAVEDSTGNWWFLGNRVLGSFGVVGLRFVRDSTVPSGSYLTLYVVSDWAGHMERELVRLTVDNDPPVAVAGPDMVVMGGELVVFDGSGSYDNVGIVNWTWTIDYEGGKVVLYGEQVSFTFLAEGVYNVTLMVRDGAGHESTDTLQVTVSGFIPEFPTVLLPAMGMVAMMVALAARRRHLL